MKQGNSKLQDVSLTKKDMINKRELWKGSQVAEIYQMETSKVGFCYYLTTNFQRMLKLLRNDSR